jgi:hypothetical protein
MKRRKHSLPPIPDAINTQITSEYTQIPNNFLRNPNISAKAKAVLCLLLSNKDGWKSFVVSLVKYMKESEETIRTGAKELENHGYLIRFHYRDKVSKEWRGSLWAYTDCPHQYNLKQSLVLLDLHGLEIPNLENKLSRPNLISPTRDSPYSGNLRTKKTNNKNTNNKNTSSEEDDVPFKNGYITPSDFNKFWKLWPPKRQGSKGAAFTKWEIACRLPTSIKPTWNRVERAIKKQLKSEQWQSDGGKYIPLAQTWIHQKRWLDDPNQLKDYSKQDQNEVAENQHGEAWKDQFGFNDED